MEKITYDPEVKILTIIFRDTAITDSEVKDNLVIDYDAAGKVVKIDVMDVELENFTSAAVELINTSTTA